MNSTQRKTTRAFLGDVFVTTEVISGGEFDMVLTIQESFDATLGDTFEKTISSKTKRRALVKKACVFPFLGPQAIEVILKKSLEKNDKKTIHLLRKNEYY